MSVHIVRAISDRGVLPSDPMGAESRNISIEGCPGQYIPASFVVHNSTGSAIQVLPTISGLGGLETDIKAVACWYQKPIGQNNVWIPGSVSLNTLTSELLVKDPAFIRNVSGASQLRLAGGGYVPVSSMGGYASTYAVQDSESLQVANIPAGVNQQYWVLVHIPNGAAAGAYAGQINLGLQGAIEITVQVLPFTLLTLEESGQDRPLFCTMIISASNTTVGRYYKNWAQAEAEVASMIRHETVPNFGNVTDSDRTSLRRLFGLMRTYGCTATRLHYQGLSSGPTASRVQTIISDASAYDFSPVMFMGPDEPTANGISYSSMIPVLSAIRSGGGQTYLDDWSSNEDTIMNQISSSYPLDLIEWASLNPNVPSKMHAKGKRANVYNQPAAGCALPRMYRRNYGLILWQQGWDGREMYAWQATDGSVNIWNDATGTSYCAAVMGYPTIDGCIDTLQLEGDREGAYDLRYMATLEAAIAAASAGAAKTSAQDYVDSLASTNLAAADLDAIRATVIDHILALRGEGLRRLNVTISVRAL